MSQGESDRNLLFGVLALQMDFITRDALIAAMHAWVLEKGKPLGRILVERTDLDEHDYALLEPLVAKHVERHGGDPERSLASLTSVSWLRQDLLGVIDPELSATVVRLGAAPDAKVDLEKTASLSVGEPSFAGQRFRILRPHASGGLGEVYVARDGELNREVALKQIKGGYADHPESRSRFLLEAEVTGGLEHPGVVPVYGLGHYPDGRPFYAMRFIRGDSLKQAIEKFHRADVQPGRDPGERALALRQLLRRFVDVCNTIAYAHSRGVLHRDLKPGNVMLGPYGETLVVDWGLAKPIGRPEGAALITEGTLRPSSGSGLTPTQMGSAVGTPAFMSPEQAAGRLDELGPASDVYSLGAMLYSLLTGRAPFADADLGTMLRKVEAGEFPPPRQVNRTVPPALEAVCLKAMANDPGGRYPSPKDLSDEIELWLAGEPVTAWREPAMVRLRRWARRHRTAVAAVGMFLLTAVLALAASTIVVTRQQAETERQRALAQTHFQQARAAVDEMLTELGAKHLADIPQMEGVRRAMLEKALAFNEQFLTEQNDEKTRQDAAMAYGRAGKIRALLGQYDQAGDAYHRAVDLMERSLAESRTDPDRRQHLAIALQGLGQWHQERGEATKALAVEGQSIILLEKLATEFPDQTSYLDLLADLNNNRAMALKSAGEMTESVAAFQRALDLVKVRNAETPEARQRLARAYGNLGSTLCVARSFAEAEPVLKHSIELAERLVADFPAKPEFRSELAAALNSLSGAEQELRRLSEARAASRKAVDHLEKLVADFPTVISYKQYLAANRYNLSESAGRAGNWREAETDVRRAIELDEALIKAAPNQHFQRSGLAKGLSSLAQIQLRTSRPNEAESSWNQARIIFEKLVVDLPSNTEYRRGLGKVLYSLGVLHERAKPIEALENYRRAVAVQERLDVDVPNDYIARTALAQARVNLGVKLLSTDPKGAREPMTKAVAYFENRASRPGATTEDRYNLAVGCQALSVCLARLGELTEARRRAEQGIIQLRTALETTAKNPAFRNSLSALQANLIDVLIRQRDYAAASRAATEWLDSSPGDRIVTASAARVMASCVPLAETDAAAGPPAAQVYADRAMDFLRRAVNEGFRDAADLRTNPVFNPLRGRSDFQLLLQDVAFPADPFARPR